MSVLPDGAYPVMLTPFTDEGVVDFDGLDRFTDWLIDRGAAGLFPVALSGEMFELSEQERVDVARRVVQRAAGRVPVLASVVEFGDADAVAAATARLAETGVDVVVLIASVLLAESDAESALWDKIDGALAAAPEVSFGVYECPLPYHRILSTPAVSQLASTGRFTFFKETSHDIATMAERVAASDGTPLKVFNAGIESLVESLEVGVSGLSGWIVNVYPEHVQWIIENGATARARELQTVLDHVERSMGPTYPASAKELVEQRAGLGWGLGGRWQPKEVDAAAMSQLLASADAVAEGDRPVTRSHS